MKLTLILISLLSLVFTSCDSLLDADAKGTVSGDILTNQAAIERALNAAYYSAGGIYDGVDGGELLGGDFILIPTLLARRNSQEISWDDVNGAPYSDFIDKDILTTNLRVEANWRRGYEVINLVNNILLNIGNVEDASAKNKIQGEALALRGILYFEMVRLWGPQYSSSKLSTPVLPLLTAPITEVKEIKTPELATLSAIYTQVENDLTQSSTLLQPFGKNGVYLNYYACQAYLMRVSLQKMDFTAAESYANNIINSSAFELANTPFAAFNNSTNSTEDIFAVQQSTSSTTGDRSTATGLANYYSSLSESGLGVMRILGFSLKQSDFLDHEPEFSNNDLRGTIDSDVDASTMSSEITTAFYTNILNTVALSSSKFMRRDRVIPIIRLAEVHLSRAEAIFEQDFNAIDPIALSDLNLIRTRAGLPALLSSDFQSSFSFYDSLVLERKRELLYEGQLFHDLKRWDGMVNGKPVSNPNFILPIPQSEIDTWK